MKANFFLVASNQKAKRNLKVEQIPKIKESIIAILTKDFDFWEKIGQCQPGIEKNNLIRKISETIKSTSFLIGHSLEQLEQEQKIFSFSDGIFVRYVKGFG